MRLLRLICAATPLFCSAFVTSPPLSPPTSLLGTTSTFQDACTGVPAGRDAIAAQVVQSLSAGIDAKQKRLSLDILPPGLNPRLETTAPYSTGLLLAYISALVPILVERFQKPRLLFSSAGDAAMAAKAFSDQGRPLPANVRLGGMTLSGIGLDDDCVVFIAPRNSVGDPVVLQVEEIVDCLSETGATFILVNPDLGEKVALGIIERDRRQNFLNSFEAAYFFRNIVTMQRPQLIPMERGALVKQWGQPWRVYVSDVPLGSGSLNRFMNMNVYLQSPEDPTVDNPPPFICAGEFDKAPSREEMSFCVEAAPRLAAEAKAEADGEAAARAEIEAKSVKDVVEAREVLTAVVAGAGDTSKVISAALSLEKNARSCRKARETALAETSLQPVFESLTRGEGVPVKAVIQFKSDLSTTNGIYFGSWPLVQFFGQMSWNEVAMRVTFGYDEMKLFGGAINIPVNIPLTPKEGFNLSSVEERWVLGRGTSGGMAVWERVANP